MHLRWLPPLILVFLTGGLLQYTGILSLTQSTILALALFGHVFLIKRSWRSARIEWPLFVFLGIIASIQIARWPPLSYSITYVFYITCTIISAVSGRIYASKVSTGWPDKRLARVAYGFLALQVAICLFQAMFTDTFIALSRAPIGFEDAIFGTLYLQSDAALAAVGELMIIIAFVLPYSPKKRIAVAAMALLIVFLGNSKAAQIAITGVLALMILNALSSSVKLNRHGFGVLALAATIAVALLSASTWSDQAAAFIQQSQDDFFRRDEWETASRFAPIGQIFSSGVDLFGNGPLTYYNPITKAWLYNAGFSTLYPLYIDYGLAGFILYFGYQLGLIAKYSSGILERLSFMLVLTSFTAFNFALTDISFIFFFNFALMLVHQRRISTSLADPDKAISGTLN